MTDYVAVHRKTGERYLFESPGTLARLSPHVWEYWVEMPGRGCGWEVVEPYPCFLQDRVPNRTHALQACAKRMMQEYTGRAIKARVVSV